MTITLEQAAERFIPHEFTIDGLDKWLTNQNIDVDGDSRFFHSWHHYENALDEANANVCIRELKGMDADCWTNHDNGIIVHMRDENGEPTIGAAFMYGVEEYLTDAYPVLDDTEFSEVEDRWLRDWFDQEKGAKDWEPKPLAEAIPPREIQFKRN
ncbi:hypothetical protein DXA22_08605 [Bifidobacterium pseudocatenulatum]|uniref:Uncharacterized protein n=1 Tax=Bifidobacterium pseudocatenulatum TaxID=28026 RepID=A0A413KBB9_BIFPS|nr:hypothetical protein DXA22_08605 [Bifidobacterium pseudocatenulatum]